MMQGGKIVFTGAHQTMGFDRYQDTMREVIASLSRLASDIIKADGKKRLRDCYCVIQSVFNVGPFSHGRLLVI
jgi:hypothetical protein